MITINKIIYLLIILLLLSGCSSQKANDKVMQDNPNQNLSITDLFNKDIPVPSGGTIENNTIVISGEFPDIIMDEYKKALI